MYAPLLLTLLLTLLWTRSATASSAPALFDNSPHGQTEWHRFCSSSAPPSSDLPPFACFTIYGDITTSAHSSTHNRLGFASASGQDFVVVAPKQGEDSKVEFYTSGFWIQILFSQSTGCAKLAVWTPVRASSRRRLEEEETALEPFMKSVSCQTGMENEPRIFRLAI